MHHLHTASLPLGAYSPLRPIKRLPGTQRLVILRCAVLASCPIDQPAATVAEELDEFEDSCVRREDGVSMHDADPKPVLTASRNLS